jgi:predicted TIM-barrel fold metal-dependent hydrolase
MIGPYGSNVGDDRLRALRELRLADFRPKASFRRPLTELAPEPPAPIVDAHNHLGRWLTGDWVVPDVAALLALMDETGIEAIVNLDGMWGDELEANLDRYDREHPGSFATFAQWDRSFFAEGDWHGLADNVRESVARGAAGLKVWKDLGLHLRDDGGSLVAVNDLRLDGVWDVIAGAGVPVTIHVGDPIAFFEPLDETNERLEELVAHPDWWFGDRSRFPTFDRIMDDLEALIARRPDVAFVGAHVLCCAEDPAWVARMLETYPNAFADIGARIPELGRVPRATRELIVGHPDRFVFGTDAFPPDRAVYETHRRFLETADESFAYSPDDVPAEGRWTISGIDLPAEVMTKLYAGTIRGLVPALA